MARYEKYKDTGIPWIGSIPEHWGQCRLKTYNSLSGRIGWNGLRSDEFLQEGYAYLVTGQDFDGPDIQWDQCYQIDKSRYDEDPFIQLKNGDLLITKDGTIGKIARVSGLDKPACLNSGIFVMKQTSDKFEQDYLFWMLVSSMLKEYNAYTSTGTTILHLYQNVFVNMPMLVPPRDEQIAIAAYLNRECAKIDAIITKQEKRIGLLEELQQAIITKAVTEGINPDVETKESRVNWIGRIPKHWETPKTLYVLAMPITDGPHETPKLFDEGIPFLSAEAVSGGELNFDLKRGYISEEYYQECCKKYVPQMHDIYMIKSGATTGRIAMVKTDEVFTIWSPLAVFRANTARITSQFLYYVLKSEYYQRQVQFGWSYGTQQNIGMRTLEKLKIALPPLNEQNDIVNEIIRRTSRISLSLEKANRQISTLREYKQSLITEVVTGKRKVC